MSTVAEAVKTAIETPLKIDIGCGKNKKPGFIGIDQYAMDGVDITADLRRKTWILERVPDELAPRLNGGAYFDEVIPSAIEGAVPMVVGKEGHTFADNSVDEVHCSHFLEHLTNLGDRWERVYFFNELHRILKPGAQCSIIVPHWCSPRFYGDPTHKEPVSEWTFLYLNRDWRKVNAPHADASASQHGYSCDFDWTYGYSLHPEIQPRNAEYQQLALKFYKDAAQDIIATITKRPNG